MREISHQEIRKIGKKHRPLMVREKLYQRVLELRREGKSHSQIRGIILEEFGEFLSGSIISRWVRGISSPTGSVNEVVRCGFWFGYVIGTILSDGFFHIHPRSWSHAVELKTKDKGYIDAFVNALKIIGLKPSTYLDGEYFRTYAYSTDLYYLVTSGEWRQYIDKDSQAKRGLLRGFFDGDGIALFPSIMNSNTTILEYVRKLLEELEIRTSPPIIYARKGSKAWIAKRNAWLERKKDVYVIYIHPDDYRRFRDIIGTSIERKRKLLEFSITISYRTRKNFRGDWWSTCYMLQRSLGRNLMKGKKKQANTV